MKKKWQVVVHKGDRAQLGDLSQATAALQCRQLAWRAVVQHRADPLWLTIILTTATLGWRGSKAHLTSFVLQQSCLQQMSGLLYNTKNKQGHMHATMVVHSVVSNPARVQGCR